MLHLAMLRGGCRGARAVSLRGASGYTLKRATSEELVRAPRELEVLKLVAEGLTNQAIAGRLGLSRKTVDVHRSNPMRKLGLHDVTEVVKYALRHGLIRLDSGLESLSRSSGPRPGSSLCSAIATDLEIARANGPAS